MVRSFHNVDVFYNIKLFRTGSISIPGVKDPNDVTETLKYLVECLSKVFKINTLKLNDISLKMTNYKTFFKVEKNQILNYSKFKNILNENHSDILSVPATIQSDKTNCLSVRPVYYTKNKDGVEVKKDYLIEMFLSGKTNIKGLYPYDTMISHLKLLEDYLYDKTTGILCEIPTTDEEITRILNNCSSTEIQDIT